MPIPVLPEVDENATMAELVDMVSILKKTVEYHLTNGLDSSNAREFGGWYIGADSLNAKNGTVGLSSAATGGNDVRFWAGNAVKESAAFRVYEDGSMVATNATISGGTISWGAVGAPLYSQIGGTKPPSNADNTDSALPASLGINYTLIGETYIYTGELNANQINVGTLTGITIQTGNSGSRIVMGGGEFKTYDAGGVARISLSPSTATYELAGMEFRDDAGVVKGHIFSNSSLFGLFGQADMGIRSLTGTLYMSGFIDFGDATVSGLSSVTAKFA